jgi:hypothetical protein
MPENLKFFNVPKIFTKYSKKLKTAQKYLKVCPNFGNF